MICRISPTHLSGTMPAIASKSMAHRLLICAAMCPGTTRIDCNTTSQDIDATIACLEALGAHISAQEGGYLVEPIRGTSASDNILQATRGALLDCGESGSTLRFMLPICCALGCDASLTGRGRLAERPLSPLYERLEQAGCSLSEQGTFPLSIEGKLKAGRFVLPGNVSSQFLTGLLLAAPLMDGPVEVAVSNPVESRPYVDLTLQALSTFGVHVDEHQEVLDGVDSSVFLVSCSAGLRSSGHVAVEGDWSNAAFWLSAGALSTTPISVSGLDLTSGQGDRAILGVLARLGADITRGHGTATVCGSHLKGCDIDARNFPDLVPPIAAVAALAEGTTTISGIARLRIKESDRIETVMAGLNALGATVSATDDTMTIEGVKSLHEGTVDAANDHRIAMMAAIAATRSDGPVTILGAQCVAKSYPGFFHDYACLGGIVQTEED